MIFQLLLLASLLFSLAVLAILLLNVLTRAWPVFQTRGIDFLTSPLSSDPAQAGISQGLFGTIVLAVLVPIFAFPFGIATAVYLEEYAPNNRLTRFIQINIRNLAGVPSIVYGLLGLAIFVAFFESIGLGGSRDGRHLLAAAVTLAVLVLPIVIITTAEALRAVPITIREAGYGVGASRWEVTRKLVRAGGRPGHPDRHGARARPRTRRDRTAAPHRRDRRRLLDARGAVGRRHAPGQLHRACR